MPLPPVVALEDEGSLAAVPEERRRARARLIRDLWSLPPEVWDRLEYLQPQIGCFNACAFCSQAAGTHVWQFTVPALRDLLAALKAVVIAQRTADGLLPPDAVDRETGLLRAGVRLPPGGLLGAARHEHKPGVIFPYLDNDAFSYPGLDVLARSLVRDFGARVRLTSVGISRHNTSLLGVHERLAREGSAAIDGLRFSFTPYAMGWGPARGFSRDEFVADFANILRVYRPVVEELGTGRDRACVEVRTPPLVGTSPADELLETRILGRHVLRSGPYLAIGAAPGESAPPTRLERVEGRTPRYSAHPVRYVLVVSDECARQPLDRLVAAVGGADARVSRVRTALAALSAPLGRADVRLVDGYRFANADGEYFALDPFFRRGRFDALHLYPRTDRRPASGYLDATRFILSAVRRRRLTTTEGALGAAVARTLRADAAELETRHERAAAHVSGEILPLWEALVGALRSADYPMSYLADPRFCIDTGVIVNQGRATRLFGGLASRPNVPLTPHEERGYGRVSFDSHRGRVFRLAPSPMLRTGARLTKGTMGRRNQAAGQGQAVIEELDGWLRPAGSTRYAVRGLEVEELPARLRRRALMVPGVEAGGRT